MKKLFGRKKFSSYSWVSGDPHDLHDSGAWSGLCSTYLLQDTMSCSVSIIFIHERAETLESDYAIPMTKKTLCTSSLALGLPSAYCRVLLTELPFTSDSIPHLDLTINKNEYWSSASQTLIIMNND